MATYSMVFQHPDTGVMVAARYSFGKVRFMVDDSGEDDERLMDETEEFIKSSLGGKMIVRAASFDEAQRVCRLVAGEQFDWGLEEE